LQLRIRLLVRQYSVGLLADVLHPPVLPQVRSEGLACSLCCGAEQ
jgi:hypothetical protein